MELVSIIVPSFNHGDYLSEALDSILAQTYTNWECIIVNDGSTDCTEFIAQKYQVYDKRFFYISQENHGVVEARNNAIKACHGKYILPLDGDDKIANTFIEKAVSIIESSEEVKIVGCKVIKFGTQSGQLFLPNFSMQTLLAMNCFVVTSLFRKKDFEEVGGYNLNMSNGLEDWDLWLSLLEKGGVAVRIPESLFYYRFKKEDTRNNRNQVIDSELKRNIVLNHPSLYYDGYKQLYDFSQTKIYKIAHFIDKLYKNVRYSLKSFSSK